jgi:HSP20 family protein
MPMRYRRFTARFVHGSALTGHRDVIDPFWQMTLVTVAAPTWRPAVDVSETDDGLSVVLEIAGIDEEQTNVALYADALVIEGERTPDASAPIGRYLRAEIRQGPFRVELPLPFAVDADRVEAHYDRGLLRVDLPRAR